MRTSVRRFTAILLCICLLSFTACHFAPYAEYELKPGELLLENGGDSPIPNEDTGNNVYQLTVEDIQQMNGGNAYLSFSDEGYLTFLQGKYYDKKIETIDDAVLSLNGLATLLGIGKGSEFFGVYGQRDPQGYTYFTLQQRYGDATVQYGTLRIAIDPEGYAVGLACSFTPNLGIAEQTDSITAEQALQIVQEQLAQFNLTYYPEATAKVAVTFNDVSYRAYAVYSNNPYASASFDVMYYEHFVSYDGQFLYNLPVSSLSTSNEDAFKASDYFNNLQSTDYTTTVTLNDGSTQQITVPVSYNAGDGLYYLSDPSRKIMVADYYSLAFQGGLSFLTSTDGKSWQNNHLIAYNNYIRAYDFYAAQGLYSVDGVGIPILVCVGLCDENQTPIDNACYCGINMGWACFAASDANTYSEAMDVIGHEFTHGVTTSAMCGMLYANETGAINEAYSDVMGNLCEMLLGATWDTSDWLVAEMSGQAMRSMSSPSDYQQPSSIGDAYYFPPVDNPNEQNDNGGVHFNNSLLSSVAYKLWKAGMSLEQERALWVGSIALITPLSGYKDVYGALMMSADINGLSQFKDAITQAFQEGKLLG